MPLRVFIFLSVILLVLAAIVLYLGWRLIRPSPLGPGARRAAWAALLLCAATAIGALIAGRVVGRSQLTNILNIVGLGSMGALLTLLPFVMFRDLLLLLSRLGRRGQPPSAVAASLLSRRAVLGVAGGTLAMGLTQAARGPVVVEVDVPIEGLPDALHGYRIVQVSDLHVGPILGETWLRDIVSMVNGLAPDLIAVTGDLVDGLVPEIAPLLKPLQDLRATDGQYFVTGNHEYYWDAPAWIEALTGLGLTVLQNEHTLIERADSRLIVAGVHDYKAARIEPTHASDPQAALHGAPAADVRILLAHQPKSLHAARTLPYDLQLSGHTHGGQFFPANLLIHLFHPVVAGLHRFDGLQVYVNRGTGWWGPPMRSPARGEVTLLRLVPAR